MQLENVPFLAVSFNFVLNVTLNSQSINTAVHALGHFMHTPFVHINVELSTQYQLLTNQLIYGVYFINGIKLYVI